MESRLNDGLSLDLETMNLKIATIAELRQRIRREKNADRQSEKEMCSDPVKFRLEMENIQERFQAQRRIDAIARELRSRPLSARIRNRVEEFLLNTVKWQWLQKKKKEKKKLMKSKIYDRLKVLLARYGDIDPMGICHIELEAEDDKKLTESNLLNITYSDKPLETLWQILNSKYSGKAKECHDRIHKDITEDPVLIELLRQAEIGNEELYEIVIDMTEMFFPYDCYSKQKIRVDITVNTGKEDAGYYRNLVFPHPEYEDEIPSDSCILWLVRQQGYRLNDLLDFRNKKPINNLFLSSVYNELQHCYFPINMLTFLVNITLKDYDRLKKAMAEELYCRRHRRSNHPHSNGYITLSSETTCGFLDLCNGLASAMGIKLEKKVILPIRMIGSAEYDEQLRHTGQSILRDTSARWTDDAILKIQQTKEIVSSCSTEN